MSRDRDPLDPEERALADALGRAVPRAGPPPAVDAAILASARRATQAPTGSGASHHRPRRRWPAVLGVAASLALAVGVAWQLRPAPDAAVPAASEGPPVVFDAPPPAPREPLRAEAETGAGTAAMPAREPPPVRELAPPMPATARSLPPAPEEADAPTPMPEATHAQATPPPPAQIGRAHV